MPRMGKATVLQARGVEGAHGWAWHWEKDGVPLPEAGGLRLDIPEAGPGQAGVYRVRGTFQGREVVSPPFLCEPVDHVRLVSSLEDEGPGTLRDAMTQAAGLPGTVGIAFRLREDPDRFLLRLKRPLPPVQGDLRILGPEEGPLTVSGEGAHRPFLLSSGSLVLGRFSVVDGRAKGGDAPGGGGASPGMGGALFIREGRARLLFMTLARNEARGGLSLPGTDGEAGGGAGFDADSPDQGGNGADGGVLGGKGGAGDLDGALGAEGGGGPGMGEGAGGGAARGGTLQDPLAVWTANLSGGFGGPFAGGGGFSVGPEGGGGDGSLGAGGGGSGGFVLGTHLAGAASGAGGLFGGDGGRGDGITGGRGGGGAGLGGAIYLRSGRLDLVGCTFQGNRAVGGDGAERGLGKGGALFIQPTAGDQGFPPVDPASLRGQAFSGNHAQDMLEAPAFDNDDFYLAQVPLEALAAGDPLRVAYRLYQLGLKLGLPARPAP